MNEIDIALLFSTVCFVSVWSFYIWKKGITKKLILTILLTLMTLLFLLMHK